MHLSKIHLHPGRLDNAWEWHRALWTLFPGFERQTNEPAPFLYRIETMNLAQGAQVLVQSTIKPAKQSDRATLLATRDIDPKPVAGQTLAFTLTANITKAIRDQGNPERKIRVPLIQEAQQIDWLKRKLAGAADSVGGLKVQPHPPTYFRKGRRPGKIVAVSVEGVMTVKNPKQLLTLLKKGVGPAKAFGCGLLLVRRV